MRKSISLLIALWKKVFTAKPGSPSTGKTAPYQVVQPAQSSPHFPPVPANFCMDNLIKMKEAMKLIKASAPTVRKYARLGYYKEYRFGEKLVFYNKQEMLDFILKQGSDIKS